MNEGTADQRSHRKNKPENVIDFSLRIRPSIERGKLGSTRIGWRVRCAWWKRTRSEEFLGHVGSATLVDDVGYCKEDLERDQHEQEETHARG
jgi:hypothetical protein